MLPITHNALPIDKEQYVLAPATEKVNSSVSEEALWEFNESSPGDPDVLIIEDNADVH